MAHRIVYGIDLGTTYSCIAYVDEFGKVQVAENLHGMAYKRILPSAVYFDGNGILVGEEATNSSKFDPSSFKAFFKRSMGEVDPDTGETVRWNVGGKLMSPQELSAYVLAKIVDNANEYLGVNVKDVVVTVPAYFTQEARAATKEAIEMAGLNYINMLDEPVAASITFQKNVEQNGDKNILVYDLGGGTFDAALVRIGETKAEVIAHHGDPQLGGVDWDQDFIELLLLQRVCDAIGKSPNDFMYDNQLKQELIIFSENMKKALTDSDICKLTFRGKIIQASRAEFDAVTGTRLESTVNLIRDMYALGAESGKNYPIPDLVLLVGGSTRMPQVRIRLEYALPGIPIRTFDPDEAVAKGAAIFASKYVDENSNVANEIIIGASKSYGLVIYDDENDVNYVNNFIIINSNINQPITETVYTWQNAQTETSLIVYENIFEAQRLDVREEMDEDTGEVRYINNRFNLKKVGESLLEFANPMPIDSPINITFDMSRGNTLSVTGEDPASHRVKQIDVKLKTELNADVKKAAAEEIQRRMQASKTR